jgi:hypothetical protein
VRQSDLALFPGARIVVRLDWYGPHLCFHIDPGDGRTIPIYLEEHRRDRRARKVQELQELRRGLVDVAAYEVPWTSGDQSGIKLYLKTIKESNAV